jgi:hypothetical protein
MNIKVSILIVIKMSLLLPNPDFGEAPISMVARCILFIGCINTLPILADQFKDPPNHYNNLHLNSRFNRVRYDSQISHRLFATGMILGIVIIFGSSRISVKRCQVSAQPLAAGAAIRGFIKYLPAYEQGQRKKGNPESPFQRETQNL